jgi:aspartate oxidase
MDDRYGSGAADSRRGATGRWLGLRQAQIDSKQASFPSFSTECALGNYQISRIDILTILSVHYLLGGN